MKKLLLGLLLFLVVSCSNKSNSVYICTGPYAKAYHNTDECRGILSCKAEIKLITLDEAQKMGRTPCGYCY